MASSERFSTVPCMKRSYAVVWSDGDEIVSGRLEPSADGFDLCNGGRRRLYPFAALAGASIARRRRDRLRGLPVLVLAPRVGEPVRIASLEGAGLLHELAQHLARSRVPITPSVQAHTR
jgi:hypothetical protein